MVHKGYRLFEFTKEITMSKRVISVRCNKPEAIYNNGNVHTDTKGFTDKSLPIAFTKLLELLPDLRGKGGIENVGDMYGKFIHTIGDKFYVLDEEIAKAVCDVVKTANEVVQKAYDAGKEEGKRILVGLNTGDLTLEQLDKK